MRLKKGSLLVVTGSEYSDYHVKTPIVVRQEFDPRELARVFLRTACNNCGEYCDHSREYLAFLESHNLIKILPDRRWHFEMWSKRLNMSFYDYDDDEIDEEDAC